MTSPSARSFALLLFLMAGNLVFSATERLILVKSVSVKLDNGEPVVEIVANAPVIPTIQKLEGPPRLFIDLPNAKFALKNKRPAFSNDQVTALRTEQLQDQDKDRGKPPVARVMLDLVRTSSYSWDAAGNRLIIRLHSEVPSESKSDQTSAPPTVTGFSRADSPMPIPISTGNRGELILADSGIAAGSLITAGDETAILSVRHGGELRVCPRTTVSVTSSSNGQDLMLGMSSGALEANYKLQSSADSVLTPDFHIVMKGPGDFHYAISTDSRGTTCVRSLPGNSASVIVSELIGDGTRQLKSSEQIVFRNGRLDTFDSNLPQDCGCPPASLPVRRAAEPSGQVIAQAHLPEKMNLSRQESSPQTSSPAQTDQTEKSASAAPQSRAASRPDESAALPAIKPNEVRVQVEAPFVFRGDDTRNSQPAPTVTPEVASVPPSAPARVEPAPVVALSPEPNSPKNSPKARKQHRGFFGKVKGFFSTVFH
ncbi:MAG: AMIN domain-containing protein [Acidobacteriota bacterium]|nr:AMIN domain-containing protein [Acidobacteriota bacterium]